MLFILQTDNAGAFYWNSLHIIRADRREAGRLLPFAEIKDALAEHLNQQSHARALHQYLKQLVGGADVQGVELEGSDSPLVQ